MATFVIIPTLQSAQQKTALIEAIKSRFGNASSPLPQGEWLVAYEGTSKQLSDDLGISEGELGSAVVLSVSGYWGRASKDIWEWLNVNQK